MSKTPDWLRQLGQQSPTVYAFVKLAEQRGFDDCLVEQLVKVLVGENVQLHQRLVKLISDGPLPLVIMPVTRGVE